MASASVSDLLASAFSSSLRSPVVTYDQKKSNPKGCYASLDMYQLFDISHLTGFIGERPSVCATQASSIEVFVKTLTGKTIPVLISVNTMISKP